MHFLRYIGIHYSGAEVPNSSLRGLRVYMADRTAQPFEVEPPATPRKYWTRAAIAAWLSEHRGATHRLAEVKGVTLAHVSG